MSFLPKHKQIKGGKVNGILVDMKTGNKYLGKFVRDHKGQYYKGESVSPKADKLRLIPFSHDHNEPDKFGTEMVTYYPRPTEKDYSKGTFTRYFVKDKRNGKIYELNKKRFILFKREGRTTNKLLKLDWYITGNPEDQEIKGYLYPGLKAKNADVTKQANKVLPGIRSQFLKDPSQFVKHKK